MAQGKNALFENRRDSRLQYFNYQQQQQQQQQKKKNQKKKNKKRKKKKKKKRKRKRKTKKEVTKQFKQYFGNALIMYHLAKRQSNK